MSRASTWFQKVVVTSALHVLSLAVMGVAWAVKPVDAAGATKPNILVVLTDDIGWGDPKC